MSGWVVERDKMMGREAMRMRRVIVRARDRWPSLEAPTLSLVRLRSGLLSRTVRTVSSLT